MAQYKVLQDIEADDKLLGPLSLRQFIYAIIVFVLGFVGFRLGAVNFFLAIPFLPPMIFFGLLAAPFGRDQPSEVWLLAKIRFFLKSRKRIWDQAGVKELVTITVPKKVERVTSKGFSEQEVSSRLKALSATLDTRGWAVKNVGTSTFQPIMVGSTTSDRLVDISNIQPSVPQVVVDPASDVLDETNNPVAQQVDVSLKASAENHRQDLLKKVELAAAEQKRQAELKELQQNPNSAWEGATPEALVALELIRKMDADKSKPAPVTTQSTQVPTQTPVTPPSDPAILKLVKNNDLNIETISRQANKKNGDLSADDGEVVISLR